MKAIFFYCFFLLLLGIPGNLVGQEIAVIYPKVKESFQAVFLDIVRGIEKETKFPLIEQIMEEDFTEKEMLEWMITHKDKVLIVLGSKGFRLSGSDKVISTLKRPLLISAVISVPSNLVKFAEQQIIVSLAPHPKSLFKELRRLFPNVKRVFTVYSANYSKSLIQEARKAASSFGINLQAYQAKGLQESAQQYKKIFQQAKPMTDSIWILQDQLTINNDVILPELLKIAWEKKLTLFSSRFSDVKRGVLFSLYPDNYALGRRLAIIAKKVSNGLYKQGNIYFLEDVHSAINIRTAQHIDLNLTTEDQERYKLIFPSN